MNQHLCSRCNISWIPRTNVHQTFALNRFSRLWSGILMMHRSALSTHSLSVQPATCFNFPHSQYQGPDSQVKRRDSSKALGPGADPSLLLILSRCLGSSPVLVPLLEPGIQRQRKKWQLLELCCRCGVIEEQ